MNDAAIDPELHGLNVEIGLKETAGDKPFFRQLLHESFVFSRASGDVDDKKWFLEKLKKSDQRETEVLETHLYANRAVVAAVVTMTIDGRPAKFHNLRLFVKEPKDGWRLLAWANEPMSA